MDVQQKGFSMVGTLAAMGMVGGLSLMIANLSKQQYATQKKAETGVELTILYNRIVNTLSDGESCTNTILSGSLGSTPGLAAGSTFAIPELKGRGSPANASGNPSRVYLQSNGIYGNRLLKIISMELVTDGATPIGGNFQVVFERMNRAYSGQKRVTKQFPLVLDLDSSNNFQSCRSTFGTVALMVKQELCSELGGNWNTTPGECSNPLLQRLTTLDNTLADHDTRITNNANDITGFQSGKADNTHTHP